MKMTPETRLHIEVEVLADGGQRWSGVVEHVRERDGRREVWVRYSTGVGEVRLGWFGLNECVRVATAADAVTAHDRPYQWPDR